VRRQGSGTFVGRVAVPTQLDERLERLEPYSSLAKRRGVTLSAEHVRIERRAVGTEVGELLELDGATDVITISRVLMASGSPAAVMFDVPHPAVALPDPERIEGLLKAGRMLLDVMIELELPIGFARTRVKPRLVTPREHTGKALQLKCSTAALEVEEVVYLGSGAPVAYSRDLFAPGALDVGVMRSFDAARPTPIVPGGAARRRARARAPRAGH
jgi:GntR family transcriptional regulator